MVASHDHNLPIVIPIVQLAQNVFPSLPTVDVRPSTRWKKLESWSSGVRLGKLARKSHTQPIFEYE